MDKTSIIKQINYLKMDIEVIEQLLENLRNKFSEIQLDIEMIKLNEKD